MLLDPPSASRVYPKVNPHSPEPKARGAYRSSKLSGKLKVLPEQAEPSQPIHIQPIESLGPPPRDTDVGLGTTTGESEDGDDEDDEEGVKVRLCVNALIIAVILVALLADLQSDLLDPRWNSEEGCDEANEEEGQVSAKGHSICDCQVFLQPSL